MSETRQDFVGLLDGIKSRPARRRTGRRDKSAQEQGRVDQAERILPLIKNDPGPEADAPRKRAPLVSIDDTGPSWVYRRPGKAMRLNPIRREYFEFGKRCELTIYPGTILVGKENCRDEFPGGREEVVFDVLRSLFLSRPAWSREKQLFYLDFSIREVAKELDEIGRSRSHGEIAEALRILATAKRAVSVENGKRRYTESYLVGLYEDEATGRRRAYFGEITKAAITQLELRTYPLELWQGVRNTFARKYLKKILFFRGGLDFSGPPHEFRLVEDFVTSSGVTPLGCLSRTKREMDRGLAELVELGLVRDFESTPVRDPSNKKRHVDHEYSVKPGSKLARTVFRASLRAKTFRENAHQVGQ